MMLFGCTLMPAQRGGKQGNKSTLPNARDATPDVVAGEVMIRTNDKFPLLMRKLACVRLRWLSPRLETLPGEAAEDSGEEEC